MKQDQRHDAGTMNLVLHLEAVHRCIAVFLPDEHGEQRGHGLRW
jgi:hypothetical protein